LYANLSEFELFCQKFEPKLLLSETRTTEDIDDGELMFNNYNIIRCDSFNRRTGGVVIYVHDSIKYNVISNKRLNLSWFLALKINKGIKNGIYGALYKSPQKKNEDFINMLI
jgi:hypothetical protein